MTVSPVHLGDALQWLRTLPDHTADLILTDPPYGTTDCQWDQAPDWPSYFAEFWRVLRPAGAILIFGQIPQCLPVLNAAPDSLRHEIIWHKNMPTGFLNAGKCPMRIHENIYVFYNKSGAYSPISINSQSGIPYSSAGRATTELYGSAPYKLIKSAGSERKMQDVIRCPIPNDTIRVHPTQKPVELLQYLIRAYSRPGDLVLDPFAGSGSTGEACIIESRKFIGCERDPNYCTIANSIIANTQPPLPLDLDTTAATNQPELPLA